MYNNKFTYDKFRTAKFGFSIFDMFSKVLSKLFTFLMNTAHKEISIQRLSIVFPFSFYFLTNRTSKQTHNNRVLIIRCIYVTLKSESWSKLRAILTFDQIILVKSERKYLC